MPTICNAHYFSGVLWFFISRLLFVWIYKKPPYFPMQKWEKILFKVS